MYGSDQMLFYLVDGINRIRYTPIVVLPSDVPYQGTLTRALNEKGIAPIHLKVAVLRRMYFNPFGVLSFLWQLVHSTFALARLIRKEGVDIVQTNTAAIIPAALAAKLAGRPHIWHVHEIIVRPRFLWRLTSYLIPRLSDVVVANSCATRDHLISGDSQNRRKTTVIYNGIEVNRFSNSSGQGSYVRAEWGVEPGQPLVGMIGRISHWKGQDYFLKVAGLVAASHPDVHFAIVGGTAPGQEHLLEEYKTLAKELNLSHLVHFSDFRSDVPAVLDAFDVFVLPSTLPEPFGNVLLEAMAAGKPVVANAHGGCVEIVVPDQTGFLVQPNQPESMAAAINYLLDHPREREDMGRRGYERLSSHFSLESYIEQFSKIYGSVLPKKYGCERIRV
jgi:glycosyltransferase involved in cell wall biosynthesis